MGAVSVYAQKRIGLELELLRMNFWRLAACGFVIVYGALMVFRNLAFYRFEGNLGQLKDLGFELLPDWEDSPSASLGDLPMYGVSVALLGTGLYTLVPPVDGKIGKKPFIMNMLLRYVYMLAIGHTLRFFTYITTTLPGSTSACGGDVSADQPKDLIEVFFTRFEFQPGNNCGDLLFSGHMLQMVTPVLCMDYYAPGIYEYSRVSHRIFMFFLWSCIISMMFFIICRRHHYSQDVILGGIVTPLLWHFFCNVIHPKDDMPAMLEDLQPSEEEEDHSLQESLVNE